MEFANITKQVVDFLLNESPLGKNPLQKHRFGNFGDTNNFRNQMKCWISGKRKVFGGNRKLYS